MCFLLGYYFEFAKIVADFYLHLVIKLVLGISVQKSYCFEVIKIYNFKMTTVKQNYFIVDFLFLSGRIIDKLETEISSSDVVAIINPPCVDEASKIYILIFYLIRPVMNAS